MVLLLLTFCLLLLSLWESVTVLCLLYVTLCPFEYCNHLDGEERAGCFSNLSSWCLVMVERLFRAVLWGCLLFVIVVFPDHTHLPFLVSKYIMARFASFNHSCISGKRRATIIHNMSSSIMYHIIDQYISYFVSEYFLEKNGCIVHVFEVP